MDAAAYHNVDGWRDSEAKRSSMGVRNRLLGRKADGPKPKKKNGKNRAAEEPLTEQMSNLGVGETRD